jgi:quinoprotein glucose dehydrogenase
VALSNSALGTLNAVDLNKGEIVWKVPLGVVPELEARGVAKTGTPSLGGTIVTAGDWSSLLGPMTFISSLRFENRERTLDNNLASQRSRHTHDLPGKKNGKQYVVIAAGGGGAFSQKTSDALVAYALPAN